MLLLPPSIGSSPKTVAQRRKSEGREISPKAVFLWLLALLVGGTGGISLHPYITEDAEVGVKVEKEKLRKKSPPKPKASDDCYWVIDGRDYRRTVDVYPCIYRAEEQDRN